MCLRRRLRRRLPPLRQLQQERRKQQRMVCVECYVVPLLVVLTTWLAQVAAPLLWRLWPAGAAFLGLPAPATGTGAPSAAAATATAAAMKAKGLAHGGGGSGSSDGGEKAAESASGEQLASAMASQPPEVAGTSEATGR